MGEDEKRNAIRKYFKAFPKWAIGFILFGVIVAVIGGSQGSVGAIAAGVVIVAIGVLGIWLGVRGKPTDEQMDQFLSEDIAAVKVQMLKKIGMQQDDLVGESQHVYGPGYGTGTEAAKVGKDRRLRYTPLRCASIGFGENQLLFYSCLLDMMTGKMLRESTDEYFYKDVVSASTKTQSESFQWKGRTHQFNDAEVFTLTTSGGTSVSVFLTAPKLASAMGVGKAAMPTSETEQAIAAIRRMLRDKKQ